MATHTSDGQVVRASKIPKLDTAPAMLNKPQQAIPDPLKVFQCPLCLDQVGRQGLVEL